MRGQIFTCRLSFIFHHLCFYGRSLQNRTRGGKLENIRKGTTELITGLDNMPDSKDTRGSLQLTKYAAGRFVCGLIT